MTLPSLDDLPLLTTVEIVGVIRAHLESEQTFVFEEEEGGVWVARIAGPAGETVFEYAYPDQRMSLFQAFGFLWRNQHVPSDPRWRRRSGDLRVAARRGVMHVPGGENIPDPDDLDPFGGV